MKKNYTLFICAFFSLLAVPAFSQSDCSGGRYFSRTYFANYDTTENILFGSGPSVGNGQNQNLKMCVFEPAGDPLAKRPVIVFAFGGSFIGGTRQDTYEMCVEFVKMGYVVAAIDYRVGAFFPTEISTTMAVVRGMHDMKAAVRFLYKDASTVNQFKVDTNYIIVGGYSAGAICAIQTAYLNSDDEIPSYLVNDTAGMGGVEGLSGNPGYSSKVACVIDFSGTIGDTAWINYGDAPLVGIHDIGDQTVPFGTGPINVSGFPTGLSASGTQSIVARMNKLGIPNELLTFPGTGHVSYLNTTQLNWDSSFNFVMQFLGDDVCGNIQGVSIDEKQEEKQLSVYPNPSSGLFTLAFSNPDKKQFFAILYDITGKEVKTVSTVSDKITLDCSGASQGIYQLVVTDGTQRFTEKIVLN